MLNLICSNVEIYIGKDDLKSIEIFEWCISKCWFNFYKMLNVISEMLNLVGSILVEPDGL
jgi:hypothetical protein